MVSSKGKYNCFTNKYAAAVSVMNNKAVRNTVRLYEVFNVMVIDVRELPTPGE